VVVASAYPAYGGYARAPAVVVQAPAAPGAAGGTDVAPSNDAERDAVRDLLRNLRAKGKDETRRPGPAPAQITVRLPADARLWVDNVACPLTSDRRSFATPRLQPGRQYAYTLRAEVRRDGRQVSESRRVNVAAGRQVNVRFDFTSELASTGR
jgi:uncharacterized protein (TIGR03000 family)